MFGSASSGRLVRVHGLDPRTGPWEHVAFVPDPLAEAMPLLEPATYLQVAEARAALAALDSTARQLPNPRLLRHPSLRREAQSTSALEGTYAPLSDVLTADEDEPPSANLREIFNYIRTAEMAFAWQGEGRPLTVRGLCDLQRVLIHGTPSASPSTGQIRDVQVVIGKAPDDPVRGSRFVPHPPGEELERLTRDLVDWIRADHRGAIDPVVAAGMAHYQFEALHPFHDGNGRVGRLLIVLQLYAAQVLAEPTLTVSPWFETRRREYYDHLLAVSTDSAWDAWIRFFATGLQESARSTQYQMFSLVSVQDQLHEAVRASHLRAESAHAVVDFAVGNPSFTVRAVQRELDLSYGRANRLVGDLTDIGVLAPLRAGRTYNRRFIAPAVHDVLLNA